MLNKRIWGSESLENIWLEETERVFIFLNQSFSELNGLFIHQWGSWSKMHFPNLFNHWASLFPVFRTLTQELILQYYMHDIYGIMKKYFGKYCSQIFYESLCKQIVLSKFTQKYYLLHFQDSKTKLIIKHTIWKFLGQDKKAAGSLPH